MTNLDLELQSIIQLGFDTIREDPTLLDKIFAHLNEPHLATKFGDKEIDKIKQWIDENDVPVVLAWALQAAKAPQISIHLSQSQEDVENAFIGDHSGFTREGQIQRTIIEEFVPLSLDVPNNTITVPSTTDLTLARPAHILVDGKQPVGEQYEIVDIRGNEIEFNLLGAAFEPRKAKIVSFINEKVLRRGEAYFRENIDIGLHGHGDQNTVLWMYSIVRWTLLRFRPELENRCMDISTFAASDFKKDNQYLGENIFTRWIRFTARTRVTWDEDPQPQIDTIIATVEVPEDGEC